MWPHASETTSKCGLSDRITNAFTPAPVSCPLVIVSLMTDGITRSERGYCHPFITGIKFKGQTHPSSPMINHSSPSGPQMTLKSTVTLRGSMEIVKIPQIERHKHTFSPFFIHSNLWGNLLVTYCHIKYKGPLWCGILKNVKAELGPI